MSEEFKSEVINCHISPRIEGQKLFDFKDESVDSSLKGYAIIPLEEYQELTGEDYSVMINEAAKAL